jgi:hypothetical protein
VKAFAERHGELLQRQRMRHPEAYAEIDAALDRAKIRQSHSTVLAEK